MQTIESSNDISVRLDRIPGNARLWLWIGKLSLGGFFEVYDLALTALLSPMLVAAGVFQKGAGGMFGMPDQATFAFLTMMGLFAGAFGFAGVADRYSRRRLFIASLLWYSVATAMMAFQTSALAICTWRFIAGIGLGLELVVIECYLAEITPKHLRGRVFSISKFVQMCAIPVAGVFANVAAPHVWFDMPGWRWVALAPAIGGVVVMLIRRGLPESPRWLAANGHAAEAARIVEELEQYVLASGGTLRPQAALQTAASPAPQQRAATYADLFQRPHRRRVFMLLAVDAASSIAFYGFSHWAPTLLAHQGVELRHSLLYMAAIGIAYPCAPLIGALFADRIERKWQVAIAGVAGAAFGLLFARQDSGAMWILFGVLLTIAIEIKSTAAHTYRSELFPTHVRARAVGFIYSITRLASALSSYLIAFTLLQFGVSGVFTLITALLLFSAMVILSFGPRSRGRAYEEITDDLAPRHGVHARDGYAADSK
ncbi:MAG: MFS transporter [Pseudomonadota bacterium]